MIEFSNDPVIRLNNIEICQDNVPVLKNVTFIVDKSEFVYLVGRTGGGKSSLLKVLYADLKIKQGEAIVVGYDLIRIKHNQIPNLRRNLGIVFQDFQLLTDRSVGDNLMFVLKATGWKDKGKMKARMSEVLIRVGLGSLSDKMPHRLSGGEQQRVVIARALLNEPKILLADEPTGNLDPEVSRDIMRLLFEINRQGTAIMMATHDYSIISDFPARILKCVGGLVEEQNKPEPPDNLLSNSPFLQ